MGTVRESMLIRILRRIYLTVLVIHFTILVTFQRNDVTIPCTYQSQCTAVLKRVKRQKSVGNATYKIGKRMPKI